MDNDIKEKFQYRPDLTGKQTVAWNVLARDDVKEVLYGRAKGGGNCSE